MLDEQIENFRNRTEPPWDDLQERRVLFEVERSLAERRSRRRARLRKLVFAVPLSLGITVLIATYFVGVDIGKKRTIGGPGPTAQFAAGSSVPASPPVEGASEFTELRVLADGSRLELSRAARIEIRSGSKKRVELAQNDGRVRYQVPPVPGRTFVIVARGVQVQVKGTVFVVDVDAGKVSVKVEQGLVRVVASSGEVELGVGDELSTPADQEATDRSGEAPSALDGSPPRAPRSAAISAPSLSILLDRADAERGSGDLAAASATLRELVSHYPNDRRTALAWFTLGKVERARGLAAAGAKAFQASFSLALDGPVSEDALAEEAVAWGAANNTVAARATAEQYLSRFPNGTHSARMQRILE